VTLLRWLDIVVCALALPVFLALDAPLIGYAACVGTWLVGRLLHALAERRARSELTGGNRRTALGLMAGAGLARVWLLALAVLLVGLSDREAGLAAALLAVAVVTTYLAAQGLTRLVESDREGAVHP